MSGYKPEDEVQGYKGQWQGVQGCDGVSGQSTNSRKSSTVARGIPDWSINRRRFRTHVVLQTTTYKTVAPTGSWAVLSILNASAPNL